MQNNTNMLNIANLQQQVLQNEIIPSYNKEIKDGLTMRLYWDKLSTRFFTASISLGTIAGIIAFAAGSTIFADNSGDLTFLSGCCSSFGTACIIFSRHCESQCKESTKKVNTILTALGITIQIPDIPSDVIDSQQIQSNGNPNSINNLNDNIGRMLGTGLTTDTISSLSGTIINKFPLSDIETGNLNGSNGNKL